jgi:hypothetical protein
MLSLQHRRGLVSSRALVSALIAVPHRPRASPVKFAASYARRSPAPPGEHDGDTAVRVARVAPRTACALTFGPDGRHKHVERDQKPRDR